MRDQDALGASLRRMDGQGYRAYRGIQGRWHFPEWDLQVDHVQGDPFAPPTRMRAFLPPPVAEIPREGYATPARARGLEALLARRFASRAAEGGGKPGSEGARIRMESPGQQVLAQTAVLIGEDGSLEARFTVALPARGRRILGEAAATLLTVELPNVVDASLRARSYPEEELRSHWETNEDAEALRVQLAAAGLVSFIADGSRLPRRSGVDDRPLEGSGVVPFLSPPDLQVTLETPNGGAVRGMGIARGVTLVVGGGYHGKSTLLRAIERGVYNHRPGDGRERVVSDGGLVKVRAEDGRSVMGVDISPFIGPLPSRADTASFTTENASGSTSQAASIMEALEAGATGLLVDEDTAATNFMIRDRRMQALVPKAGEPITPFIDRVHQLAHEVGVSSVLVLGGSGDYLDVADAVIVMEGFLPRNVTREAREIAREYPTGRSREAVGPFPAPSLRVPLPDSVDLSRGRKEVSVRVREVDTVALGKETLDLTAVEQIVSWAQTRALSQALIHATLRVMDGKRSVPEILDDIMGTMASEGLDGLQPHPAGDLAEFRRFELAAALNRLRTLRVVPG